LNPGPHGPESLAFITALQVLAPRQRAALILTDVLDFSAREVADMLETTEHAAYGAVKRARATLARQLPTVSRRRCRTHQPKSKSSTD
jgi:DNA-directed RNA polymerase specialized sigma24 family protein